jgi:hypothetical protein
MPNARPGVLEVCRTCLGCVRTHAAGFNTIKLLFSFQALKAAAANQTAACRPSTKAAWAARATAPQQRALKLNTTVTLPDPAVYLPLAAHNGTAGCNSYLPAGDGLTRLLWTVQYLVANGFYVVVSGVRALLPAEVLVSVCSLGV